MLKHCVGAAQVVKNAKQVQARKARSAGAAGAAYADEAPAAEQPRRWSDYTVHFHFPDPTEVNAASLLQARAPPCRAVPRPAVAAAAAWRRAA